MVTDHHGQQNIVFQKLYFCFIIFFIIFTNVVLFPNHIKAIGQKFNKEWLWTFSCAIKRDFGYSKVSDLFSKSRLCHRILQKVGMISLNYYFDHLDGIELDSCQSQVDLFLCVTPELWSVKFSWSLTQLSYFQVDCYFKKQTRKAFLRGAALLVHQNFRALLP